MNLVWLIGCLSLFCKRIIITRLVVFVILKRLSLLSPTSQIIFSSEHTTYWFSFRIKRICGRWDNHLHSFSCHAKRNKFISFCHLRIMRGLITLSASRQATSFSLGIIKSSDKSSVLMQSCGVGSVVLSMVLVWSNRYSLSRTASHSGEINLFPGCPDKLWKISFICKGLNPSGYNISNSNEAGVTSVNKRSTWIAFRLLPFLL